MLARIVIIVSTLTLISGCAARRQTAEPCCLPANLGIRQVEVAITEKEPSAGVTSNFTASYQAAVPVAQTEIEHKLLLEECICLAAKNSATADLIDQERIALARQQSDICPYALDVALMAQAIEKRNEAAGLAGSLFLKLVELHLQQEVLQASRRRLMEFRETINVAGEQGFAIAEGLNEVEKRSIELDARKLEIPASISRVNFQLCSLIGLEPVKNVVQPVFQLAAENDASELASEITTSLHHRANLVALQHLASANCNANQQLRLLSVFDSRLGQSLPARVARKKLLKLRNDLPDKDPSSSTRQQQLADVYSNAKKLVASEVAEAFYARQSAALDLQRATSEIRRLETLDEQIQAKQQLDSIKTYLEAQQNWIDSHTAKSERISAAIELETANVRLLKAQGLLAEGCGYRVETHCACHCE